ncbi:response regulator [Patulibacter minatonensis]|uniref:response regulator n=1 Tax=Patulibacter minatonensis TaxID=298163 RepID=UPI0006870A65|nr:response regulator transcription factor [Patulibacter minatonensis]
MNPTADDATPRTAVGAYPVSDAVAPVTILVADDNERFRGGMVRALRRRPGVEVVADVENGARALEEIRALRPQLVLVDARMPIVDGLTVARTVTADPDLAATKVLLLSARHDRVLVEDARVAGAVACLDKSDSRREICDAVLAFAPGHEGP